MGKPALAALTAAVLGLAALAVLAAAGYLVVLWMRIASGRGAGRSDLCTGAR